MFTKDRPVSLIATVEEDNQGALILSTSEPGRHTPRSKNYAIKLHWLHSWLIPKKIGKSFVETKKTTSGFSFKINVTNSIQT